MLGIISCLLISLLARMFVYFTEKELKEVRNLLFTACKVGDIKNFNAILENLNRPRTASEEAQQGSGDAMPCDSIQIDIACEVADSNSVMTTAKCKYNKDISDILNKPFGDQEKTLLHVAAAQSQKPIIYKLLEAGADPAIK